MQSLICLFATFENDILLINKWGDFIMIGEKIQLLRKQNNMSQEKLAQELNVTRQAVSKWELGNSTPELENIVQISELFNVTTDYIIKDEEVFDNKTIVEKDSDGENYSKEKIKLRKIKIWGIILSGIGVGGNLIIWILSTMIRVYGDYSYFDFIEKYRLHAITWILYITLAAGLILIGVVYPMFDKKDE